MFSLSIFIMYYRVLNATENKLLKEASFKCLSHPLLMVGDDAAQEVGVGVAECGHQFGQ